MAEIREWGPASGGDSLAAASWGSVAPATQATQVGTFTGIPVALETVTIGSQVYRWVASMSGCSANDVLIGADGQACRDNLLAAIVRRIADLGVLYCATTAVNADVTAVANSTDKIDLTSIKYGTDQNSIVTTDTSTNFSWGGATLAGGLTNWATGDEVHFTGISHLPMTDNLDWDELLSPDIDLGRVTKRKENGSAIGSPGVPWKFRTDSGNDNRINWHGLGTVYSEIAAGLPIIIQSGTTNTILSGLCDKLFVRGGNCDCKLAFSAPTPGGTIWACGPTAFINILDDSLNAAYITICQNGHIVNERKHLGNEWIIIGPLGNMLQQGKMIQGDEGFINFGTFSYQPVASLGSDVFSPQMAGGRTDFSKTRFKIKIVNGVVGPSASFDPGATSALAVLDLRKEYP